MLSSKDDRVVVRTGSALRTEVAANGYTLVADEPIGVGGTNSGPTPYPICSPRSDRVLL
jgi:hypothetical protein